MQDIFLAGFFFFEDKIRAFINEWFSTEATSAYESFETERINADVLRNLPTLSRWWLKGRENKPISGTQSKQSRSRTPSDVTDLTVAMVFFVPEQSGLLKWGASCLLIWATVWHTHVGLYRPRRTQVVSLSVCLFVCMSVSLSVCMFVCLSVGL